MKKLETLRKEATTVTADTLSAIVNCKDINCEALTENEKLAILVFNEYSKAINNKSVSCVLDCNYSNSKLHAKVNEDGELDPVFCIDYFRIIDEHNDCLARCYIHISKKAVTTDIRFSAKKAVLAVATSLEKYADFEIFRYKETQKVRNVRKQSVPYEDFAQTAKLALALLSDSKKLEVPAETAPDED